MFITANALVSIYKCTFSTKPKKSCKTPSLMLTFHTRYQQNGKLPFPNFVILQQLTKKRNFIILSRK